MAEFRTVRGMRDFLPEDTRMMRYVEDIARKVAALYRYEEVMTPIVETYELLSAKAGEEVKSRMFAFKDLGGRDVALRPEFTASVARLVATTLRNEPRPFRLFCLGSIYRYDEPQRGRYREFWQSNYELMGSDKPEADAEILILTDALLRGTGVKNFSFKVGHVGVLRGIMSQEKVEDKVQNAVMQLMDKKQYDGAFKRLEETGVSKELLAILTDLIKLRGSNIIDVLNKTDDLIKDYTKAVGAARNLREILNLVSESGCKIEMTVDAGFARGLEYYTGVIFEIFVSGLDMAIGGGGRYDRLIELFGGEHTPAVGVAHGIDRMMLALQTQGAKSNTKKEKIVVVIPAQKELRTEALKVAQMLRNADVSVEMEVMGRRMTKALEDADRRKADLAVIIGEREFREGAVVVKDLVSRKQETVKVEKIVGLVK